MSYADGMALPEAHEPLLDQATEDSRAGLHIAIIGMAGRFPGAPTLEHFWQNLCNGVESITFFSAEELLAAGIDPDLLENSRYVRAGATLEGVDQFDAGFFGFTPREAETADPQQRLFLECAWEALEHAGYTPAAYDGLIGVYAGASTSSYALHLLSNPEFLRSAGELQVGIGTNLGFLSTRVSYKLNLTGPSINVQTACSTSLVALHLACQSLLTYQCDLALAGGVSVGVPQTKGYLYQANGIESPDGHTRAFDANAQGTLFGSGAGVVVLKRLEDAVADSDQILAVIRGSAINNDGGLKVGYTAPSEDGQAIVISTALGASGIAADTVGYVEAHGTATPVGDLIETAALTQAFRSSTGRTGFCALGSVKTNIGHCDAAAGIAGLIKTVLALQHKQIPPSLHFDSPNPKIDFSTSPFFVQTALADWHASNGPRRAGVSAFGIGGTNAHVILEEAPERPRSGPARAWQLLALSAKTPAALEQATTNIAAHMQQHPAQPLADIAYTYQIGRFPFRYRRTLVCRNAPEALSALRAGYSQTLTTADSQEFTDRPVVFMFPGQGAQYAGMALDLYRHEPIFREHLDRCVEILKSHLGLDLREVLYPAALQHLNAPAVARREDRPSQDHEQRVAGEPSAGIAGALDQTWLTQPALFVIEYALAKLLLAWGIAPQALIGHSIGEYVAACLAEVFSLEDALALVATRGRLIQELAPGAMLSVAMPARDLAPLLSGGLSLAAHNAPAQAVVAGPAAAVDQLEARLASQGVSFRRLHTSHAFHSAMLDPIVEPFKAYVQTIRLSPPRIPIISTVTGIWMTTHEATSPDYWVQQLRQTVRFADGLGQLLLDTDRILLEVGPGHTLTTLARQQFAADAARVCVTTLRGSEEQTEDTAALLTAVGQLWAHGAAVDWVQFYAGEQRQRVAVPTYPFERQRYWVARGSSVDLFRSRPATASKRPDLAIWFYVPSWNRSPGVTLTAEQATADQRWLIFSDDQVGVQLAERLRRADKMVITVTPGPRFERLSGSAYTLDPRAQSQYTDLLAELAALNQLPTHLLHCWSLLPKRTGTLSSAAFEIAQEYGCFSIVKLAQTLGKHDTRVQRRLWVVASGLHEVIGGEPLYPEHATLLAPCKVIPQEYPNITCHTIDIARAETGRLPLDQLTADIQRDSRDAVIAYRGAYRWVQTFAPFPITSPAATPHILRQHGVYLITGGLGRMGLLVAEYLAEAVQANLILVDQLALPSRDQWSQDHRHSAERTPVDRLIAQLQSIEQLGATVSVIQADVADSRQMRSALEPLLERFPAIHGIIHAAGAGGGVTTIEDLDDDVCAEEFRAKVGGLLALEQLLQGQSLDFCVLLSSLSSLLGGLGHTAYAAANLFMDSFAAMHNQSHPRRWTSVNWETWNLSPDQDAIPAVGAQRARLSLTAEETRETFRRVLAVEPVTQLIISSGDLQTRIDQWVNPQPVPKSQEQAPGSADHARPELQIAYAAPIGEVEEVIAGILQEVIGVARVGRHDNFFDLGGDSLLAVQVAARLRDLFKVELPLRSFFDQPTVAQLAETLTRQQAPQDASNGLEALLQEIESLSPDEVEARLLAAEQMQQHKDGHGYV